MSAQRTDMPNAPSDRQDPARGDSAGGSAEFQQSLRDLAEAVSQRKVEPVCTSYLALRRAGRGMSVAELLDSADRATGGAARSTIVSAFSHRKCFMCEDGTTVCGPCKGTGVAEGFPCPQCDGLGVEACAFCQGSGWSDRDEAPAEIRRAVLRRQSAHVEKEIGKLAKLTRSKALALAHKLPQTQRRQLAAWLLRLQARLANLAETGSGNGDDRAARYGALATKINELLEQLRTPAPPAPRQDDGQP